MCSDFRAQENKICHCFHFLPSICHEVMGPDAIIFIFWMLNFKPAFSLSCFTFIKGLFTSSSLSATRVVSSAYLRLLLFLGSLDSSLIHPARHFTWHTLHRSEISQMTMYSLDMVLSSILNQPFVPCPVLTVASCPAYRFLRRQVRWSATANSFKNFPVCCDPHSQML